MTTPLSQEQRAELVAVAATVKTPYAYTILAYEATVVALEAANRVNVIKLAAALERAKALADEIDGFEVVGTLRGTAFASGWEAAQRFISGHVRALLTPKDPGQ